MAEKSLFFNALPDATSQTGYDRNYNADDISDWLSVIWETGVVKTNTINGAPTGLKVVATTGMNISVNAGKAAIRGKAYINNAAKTFTITTAPTGSATRYDYIVLKLDNNVSARSIQLELRTGTSTIPSVMNLTRNNNVYELMLAYISVKPNATSITTADITDKRGDIFICPWFTAVKGYEDYYDAIMQTYERSVTMASAGTTVITNLAASLYNNKYSIIEVYTNGIKEPKTAYNVSTSGGFIVITFTASKAAGAKITVDLGNFIDGEGLSTAIAGYTQFTADVTALNTKNQYTYVCNGINDNILIGNIVRSFLSAGTDYGTMKLNVIGNIGMTVPAYGDGTVSNPNAWFNFNTESNRKVIIDFSSCGQIAPTITDGTYNNIFHSNNDIHIIGANIVVSNTATNTIIRIMNTTYGSCKFENCRFYITAYKDSLIALRGTFNNCRGSVANVTENSYCFLPASNSVVKINGGEYYAYTGDSNKQSAIVGQSGADAVSILYGVSAPTSARTGYYQTNSLIQYVGGGMLNCTDLISELPLVVAAGISNIRGTIAKSKKDVW